MPLEDTLGYMKELFCLPQSVLLSLIQQLSVDLGDKTEVGTARLLLSALDTDSQKLYFEGEACLPPRGSCQP